MIKKEIEFYRTLLYNDLPEIFLGIDKVGTKYIFLLTNYENDEPEYISTEISENRLNSFLKKNIDLRDVFKYPELGIWYKTITFSDKTIIIEKLDFQEISEDFLPENGFYIDTFEEKENLEIANEAQKHNNTIIHFSLSDSENKNEINVSDLSLFLDNFQALVKATFKKVISLNKLKDLDNESNHILKAFSVSNGSFKVHLKGISNNNDLFSGSTIDLALRKLDDIIFETDNEDNLLEVFQGIKGHSIKSYKKLISSIVLKNIDVTYEWFSLENNKPRKRTITKNYAKKVLEILNKKSELSKEIKEFTGYLLQADTEKGTWRINNLEDKKEYSGTSKIEMKLLSGVTLETQLYKLICEEIIEENNLNHNEKVKYKLNKIIIIQ